MSLLQNGSSHDCTFPIIPASLQTAPASTSNSSCHLDAPSKPMSPTNGHLVNALSCMSSIRRTAPHRPLTRVQGMAGDSQSHARYILAKSAPELPTITARLHAASTTIEAAWELPRKEMSCIRDHMGLAAVFLFIITLGWRDSRLQQSQKLSTVHVPHKPTHPDRQSTAASPIQQAIFNLNLNAARAQQNLTFSSHIRATELRNVAAWRQVSGSCIWGTCA